MPYLSWDTRFNTLSYSMDCPFATWVWSLVGIVICSRGRTQDSVPLTGTTNMLDLYFQFFFYILSLLSLLINHQKWTVEDKNTGSAYDKSPKYNLDIWIIYGLLFSVFRKYKRPWFRGLGEKKTHATVPLRIIKIIIFC